MTTVNSGSYKVDGGKLISIAEKLLNELNLSGDITIKFGDMKESKELNSQYRKKEYATDVLSFPFNEILENSFYIGDILICYPIAEKQAKERSISTEREIITLMVHGILHLAGYDHETDKGEMLALQDSFIEDLNL